MTTKQERLRSVAATIRTKPTPLSDFIPLLNQTADHIDKLEAENARLTECLKKANSQAEHFEREWYLRGDENERLRKDAERKPMDKENQDVIVDSAQASPWTFRRSARWVIEATERHHGIKRTP